MKLAKNTQEKAQQAFLEACKGYIRKYPSKKITGMCCDCFLWYIQRNEDYIPFICNHENGDSFCYSVACFLQEKGIIKIKSGILSGNFSNSIDCFKFSFLSTSERNKI